jgi:polyisoprenoid-binding protein YceI
MKKILSLLLCVGIINIQSWAQSWKPTAASVTFKVKMFGVAVEGSFKGFVGTMVFDPNNLTGANMQASVDARTLDTDNSLRNKHLREKEEFFDVAKYPTVKMKSVKFEKAGNGYVGYFDLTIKKTTKNVKIPFTFSQNGTTATFAGAVTINRRDWDLGGGTLGMSNDASVSIVVNAQPQP